MTIFLTTQYLEEADELADVIGIINKGVIVAEDSPAKLKMQIGNDVIIIELKSALKETKKLEKIAGVTSVKQHDKSLSIYAKNGGAVISEIVSVLQKLNVTILNVEIRKPTLDDVFLKVTGEA
jgi:ABC-2 type transport system ATP-binding protein